MSEDSGIGAGNLLTFLFGIAVGVVGTLVYAAANEDQFRGAVKRTRDLAGSAHDTFEDYADDASAKVRSLTDKVQDGVESAKAQLKGTASDAADAVEQHAKQAKRELNS